jgi:hypothetical protein
MVEQPPFYYAQLLWIRNSARAHWRQMLISVFTMSGTHPQCPGSSDGWRWLGCSTGAICQGPWLWHGICWAWNVQDGFFLLRDWNGWNMWELAGHPSLCSLSIVNHSMAISVRLFTCWLAFPRVHVPRDPCGSCESSYDSIVEVQ